MSSKLEQQIRALRREGYTEREAAATFGKSRGWLRNRCAEYGIRWNHTRHYWQPYEDRYLRALYPHFPTRTVAEGLERTESQVYQRARALGLAKHPAYLDTPDAGRLDGVKGKGTRFEKGHVPANKGVKGIRRSPQTEFQPGQVPHTWQPIGSTRVSKDDYLQRKMTDTGYPPHDWVGEHIIKWRRHRGPIPNGHVVVFKNGDKRDVRIANLECIPRAELARRNRMWNRYPPELARTIHHLGQFRRRLREYRERAA